MPQTPLLNFIDFVFDTIELQDFDLYITMTNEDYHKEVTRDNALHGVCNSIAKRHFDG